MKLWPLSAFALITLFLNAFVRAQDKPPKEEIKFPSPDGKFALRLFVDYAHGLAQTAIIKMPKHAVVRELDDKGAPYIWEQKLVWSADSRRVAFFRTNHRGGDTTVYFRTGDSFKEVELPELPSPEFSPERPEACEVLEHVDRPIRWLESGALLLYSKLEDECENKGAVEITIGFDKEHKPSILKATKTAVLEQ